MLRLSVVAMATMALAARAAGADPPRAAGRGHPVSVQVQMRNVDLHVAEDVTLRVRSLQGRFVATGGVPNLDDSRSYVVEVAAGEVAISEDSLNALLNEHVFGHGGPIRDVRARVEGGELKQKGVLKKGIAIPFDVKGGVEPTPDGRIRVHARSIRSLGLPMKPLLKLLGLDLQKLVKLEAGHGVTVDGNDFVIDPQRARPPPRLRGRVTAVRLEGHELVQTFGSGPPALPAAGAPNYIRWSGGVLQFGKLTMKDVDLELIDQDPKTPFDFSVAHYRDMLVAGYSKTTPSGGLLTYMPDYSKLQAASGGGAGR
jgi:hypothetical protein